MFCKNYVKEYLDAGHSLEDLKNDLGISYNEYENMIIFSYSQIDSPKTNPIVRMCRGLVLEKDTWEIINYPFYRFYNFEEVPEEREKFNWDKACSTTKIDGSLFSVFKYKNKWYTSTRSQIGGHNFISDGIHTFGDLFKKAISPLNREEFFEELDKLYVLNRACFTFELTSPLNIIVTPYTDHRLWLIGGRDLEDGSEICFKNIYECFSDKLKGIIKCPEIIPLCDENGVFRGFDEMKKLSESGEATDEGFVVVDFSHTCEGNFPRTKVKNSAYVALHHLRGTIDNGSLNYANIMSIVYKNECDEVCASLPQYEDIIRNIERKWKAWNERFLLIVNQDALIPFWNMSEEERQLKENKAAFAKIVTKDKNYSSMLFLMFNKNLNSLSEVIELMSKTKAYDTIFKNLWENYVSKEN